jgi:hypothetical protein
MADHVAFKMECQPHHNEDRRAASDYPASMLLSEMRNGGSLYPLYVPRLEMEDKEDSA